ncbi:hypothetical protein BDR04DRAFT_1109034, partial [Suillus decipiens]
TVSYDLKSFAFLFFVIYRDFLLNKSVRFSVSENPLYTKLYSSMTNSLMLPTQIHANYYVPLLFTQFSLPR